MAIDKDAIIEAHVGTFKTLEERLYAMNAVIEELGNEPATEIIERLGRKIISAINIIETHMQDLGIEED